VARKSGRGTANARKRRTSGWKEGAGKVVTPQLFLLLLPSFYPLFSGFFVFINSISFNSITIKLIQLSLIGNAGEGGGGGGERGRWRLTRNAAPSWFSHSSSFPSLFLPSLTPFIHPTPPPSVLVAPWGAHRDPFALSCSPYSFLAPSKQGSPAFYHVPSSQIKRGRSQSTPDRPIKRSGQWRRQFRRLRTALHCTCAAPLFFPPPLTTVDIVKLINNHGK